MAQTAGLPYDTHLAGGMKAWKDSVCRRELRRAADTCFDWLSIRGAVRWRACNPYPQPLMIIFP
jgi:hypothetical protein